MNIFKVIGRTDDSDEKYPSIDGSVAVDRAIMTEVRKKGVSVRRRRTSGKARMLSRFQ